MKDIIRSSIEDAIDDNPNAFSEKINDVFGAKLADALQTKKIEISNNWLNDIEPPSQDEEE